ncbi:hypothetical protein ACJV2T_01650 [Gardnerella sp. Marseille-Q9179]|uniref:hypothetical protein n=1 Tax=Gardnerella sp. Marseille-Q9179 TaxID=3383028 RepID=UPI003AF68C7D
MAGVNALRDDLLERSTARAKATRSGNSLRLEVQWTSNASFIASAYSASVGWFMEHLPEFYLGFVDLGGA